MRTIIAVMMALLPGVAAAQVNKCLDASGKIVGYGAECPAGTRSEQTTIKNAPAQSAPAQKSLAERDADFRKRQAERQESEAKAAKSATEATEKKRACADSQSYLKALQSGVRIRSTDPKTGERNFLSDAEIQKEAARAQAAVSANCK